MGLQKDICSKSDEVGTEIWAHIGDVDFNIGKEFLVGFLYQLALRYVATYHCVIMKNTVM